MQTQIRISQTAIDRGKVASHRQALKIPRPSRCWMGFGVASGWSCTLSIIAGIASRARPIVSQRKKGRCAAIPITSLAICGCPSDLLIHKQVDEMNRASAGCPVRISRALGAGAQQHQHRPGPWDLGVVPTEIRPRVSLPVEPCKAKRGEAPS